MPALVDWKTPDNDVETFWTQKLKSLLFLHISIPRPELTMSAIRQSVRELNRSGVFSATTKRAFCAGVLKTEDVKDKDLFITKVHCT